jgi:hypothetical protein
MGEEKLNEMRAKVEEVRQLMESDGTAARQRAELKTKSIIAIETGQRMTKEQPAGPHDKLFNQ